MDAGCLSLSLKSHTLAACLSLSVLVAAYLSLSLSVQLSRCMSLTVSIGGWLSITFPPSAIVLLHVSHCSYGCWQSLTVSLVPWSFCMSLTVSYCNWMSLIVSPTAIEFLNVSHCPLWLLAVSHFLFGPMEFLHIFHGLFHFHLVAACLSLSPMVSGCLILSLQSHAISACLSLFPIVAGLLSLSIWSHGVAPCLSMSPIVTDILSLSLPVPWSFCISFAVSYCYWFSLTVTPSTMEFLHVSHCLLWLMDVSPVPWSCYMSV